LAARVAIVAGVGPETQVAGPVVESEGVTVVSAAGQLFVSSIVSEIFWPGYRQVAEAVMFAEKMHGATVKVGETAVADVTVAPFLAEAVK